MFENWLSAITGPGSVPALFAGVFYKDATAAHLLLGTGIFGFFIASFIIWTKEREKAEKAQHELASSNNISIDFNQSNVDFTLYQIDNGHRYRLGSFPIIIRNVSDQKSLFNVKVSIFGDYHFLWSLFEGGAGGGLQRMFRSEEFQYEQKLRDQLDPGVSHLVELVDIKNGFSVTNDLGCLAHEQDFVVAVSAQNTTRKVIRIRYDPTYEPHFTQLS